MKRVRSDKRINLILLLAAAVLALVFAGTSLSRFVFEENDRIQGSYTNFILEHDGEGQTAILQDRDGGKAAFLLVNIRNFEEGGEAVSARAITYSIRTASEAEAKNGIKNAWGDVVLPAGSVYAGETDERQYTLAVADDAGNPLDQNSDEYKNLTSLGDPDTDIETPPGPQERSVQLRLDRTGTPLQDGATETLTVVLETDRPYKDVRAFNVTVTSGLISASMATDEYFGFVQKQVNVRTSADYAGAGAPVNGAGYGAELAVSVSGNAVFDLARFQAEYPSVECSMTSDGAADGIRVYTVKLRPGSDVNFNFYTVRDGYTVTLTARVNGKTSYQDEFGNEVAYYPFVSGLTKETNENGDFTGRFVIMTDRAGTEEGA